MPVGPRILKSERTMSLSSTLKAMPDLELLLDEPLSRHTTFRVGGPVRCLARPRSEKALLLLLQELREKGLPHVVLGGGSNVLPPDRPWEAAAIQLKLACRGILRMEESAGDSAAVYAGAGRKLGELVRYCVTNELEGMESLAGIPGTVGGALVMNAGVPAETVSDCLVYLDLVDAEGIKRRVLKSELSPGYRSMGVPEGAVVLGGCFRFAKGSGETLKSRMQEILQHRKRTQPLRYPSAGSIFKNPPGHSAGALIEKAGLKGCRIGDAEISRKHANWIINRGNALAGEIRQLIEKIENVIFGTFGVRLEREIRILGQP